MTTTPKRIASRHPLFAKSSSDCTTDWTPRTCVCRSTSRMREQRITLVSTTLDIDNTLPIHLWPCPTLINLLFKVFVVLMHNDRHCLLFVFDQHICPWRLHVLFKTSKQTGQAHIAASNPFIHSPQLSLFFLLLQHPPQPR